jgi:carbon-monoxide dehydrogenase medium subunit
MPAWPSGRRWAFVEFAIRPGDFALAGIALHYDLDATGAIVDAHIATVGACYSPRRLTSVEAALDGAKPSAALHAEAARLAGAAVDDVNDMHASAAYRRSLVETLTRRALDQSAERTPCA